ncbi:MAG: winged helix-turn-helix domain-containing protein [Candidatus Micrarchaeota archaeon]
MDLRFHLRKDASRRNIAVIALLLLAVGALYYQNVAMFSSFYSYQQGNFDSQAGPPLLNAGADGNLRETAAQEDAAAMPLMKSATSADAGVAAPPSTLATETYREKGPLQEQALYYAAIGLLGMLLFLNIFKVSFQSAAVFDSDIFKTLSSETRVEMLYALQERRKTLSELAMQAGISLPGAKQHLSMLETKGLIRKLDEGRKWKYYELTDQGKSIIAERFA